MQVIIQACSQLGELLSARMKNSRVYVILVHLVLSTKSVYNF